MIALFFGLGVLPLLVLGVVSYRQSMHAVEELLAAETTSITQRTARELESRHARYQSDLTLLAENLETLNLLRAHYEGGEAPWESVFPSADAYLQQVWNQFRTSYRWIEFRDTTDKVFYTLGEPRNGRPFSGGVSTPELQQEFRFSRSIPDPRGPTSMGFVVAVAPMDQLLPPDALAQAFGRSGYTVVLDLPGNRVLAHPRRSRLQATASSLLGPEGWRIDSERLERKRGSFVFRLADSVRVASFATLETPEWTVLATTAVDEFAGPFTRTRRLFLTIVGLVTVAVSAAFLVMTGRATRSLESLTRAADAVAAGDYSPPLPPAGADEVGRLSAAFGAMARRVEETLRRIQESRHMAVLGEFTSRLSHEVRNPLTSVKLNLQRIERCAARGGLPEECLGPLEISLSEISRLDGVVQGALSLARTGAPTIEPCSVHEVLRRAAAALEFQLEDSAIQIERDLEATRDTILGNAEALQGVFLNLFLNAADAMPEGGRISVNTRDLRDSDGGSRRIQVQVQDEGSGVPPDLAERIFEPFFSTKSEGTGFGLPVASNTVADHGGTLRLEPSLGGGEGAVFVIELPLYGGEEGAGSE